MNAAAINHLNIANFIRRSIGHASAVAIDSEFGLRVRDVSITEGGNVRIEFDDGSIVNASFVHYVPHRVPITTNGKAADAHR